MVSEVQDNGVRVVPRHLPEDDVQIVPGRVREDGVRVVFSHIASRTSGMNCGKNVERRSACNRQKR